MHRFLHNKSATGIRLEKFGLALMASPPFLLKSRQLIFLCGANQSANTPSVRRATLKAFIHKISASSKVLYAEGVFNELRKLGKQKNALDLEHLISEIADKIIIILESESAFCELGAFAKEDLRKKLIVINNSAFKESESFINTGPIAAITEAKSPVIWYPMSLTGKTVLDGIGATYSEIDKAINQAPKSLSKIDILQLAAMSMKKECLYFVRDLVLLAGPITHAEIIDILKYLFKGKSYDLVSNLLGILRESGLVVSREVSKGIWVYHATDTDFFLKYQYDLNPLMASFRTFHMRNNPNRFNYG